MKALLKKKALICFLFLSVFVTFSYPQITVTSPSSRDNVKAAADYADEILLDRWDMDKRTDPGWRIFNTIEMPTSGLTNISFSSGILSADTSGTDPNITLLDCGYPGSCFLGKNGTHFPINANKYTMLVIRMYLQPDVAGPWGQLLWSKNTIYGGITTSGSFFVKNNWFIYFINIPSLGVAAGSDPWNGNIDSLRIDPIIFSGKNIKVDWVRLVENSAPLRRTITWTGSGGVDIYLDNDNNPGNGNLGKLAENVSGGSYSYLAGGLLPGDYYVAISPTGTSNYSYSAGYYHINDVPILNITSPNAEGSTSDFITVATGDPWDMVNSADVEHTEYVASPQFTTINYEDIHGNQFYNQNVYLGSRVIGEGSGDPIVFFLHFLQRGATYRIDTSRYHNLVFKMGIAGTQSVNDGSVARVIWKNVTESVENVSEDIIIRHLPGRWVMNKIICDMKDLPIEQGAGSPSHSGWNGELDSFRIDPHEFSDARQFFFDDIKLTADIKADTTYTFEWMLSDSDHNPTVSLYYDTDNTGYNGTPIVQNLPANPGAGSYIANISSIPSGKYWIYAVTTDGINQNRAYATGPLFIDHSDTPSILLSNNKVNLGAQRNGPTTGKETITITNTGQGSLDWTANPSASWIDVSPTSGAGDGQIEVGVGSTALSPGFYTGTVSVSDPAAINSPQIITVNYTVYAPGEDSAPFGSFDTPVEGSVVSGSVAVTGWALDDIEVSNLEIKREPDPDDAPEAIGSDGLVFIGNAIFVKGSRQDVAGLYPNYPRYNRAGWGYMLLTYGFPRLGNGTFRLYAFAVDATGHRTLLGTKQITSDNANRTAPFGSIDTPDQGGIASGDYVNFGWVLTPPPKFIPTNGSTIWISIDGIFVANPSYNHPRQDIYDSFPGYLNRDGPVGYYYIDTTQYANGPHTIGWYAVDNEGSADGFGSRFFEIMNLGGSPTPTATSQALNYSEDFSGRLQIKVDAPEEIRELEVEELARVEIKFLGEGGDRFVGWGEDPSKPLPIGSTLDQETGAFYWSLGPGFLGPHTLHFAVSDGQYRGQPVEILVRIVPKTYHRAIEKKRPIQK
jgi:hypothetical protein